MKRILPLTTASVLLALGSAHAALVTETYGPSVVNLAIPDNQPVLTSFLESITTSSIVDLTQVTISLELRGTTVGAGFASDIFASLIKSPLSVAPTISDPSAILLNGVGINGGDPVGFSYDGWNITFSDVAGSDIHLEAVLSGVLTGTYQPDGRTAPTDTLRPAMLSAFAGGAGNGDWRLNIGDLADGGTMQLVGWTLTLTGQDASAAVPEASTWAAGVGMAAIAGASWWRARRRAK